MKKVVPKWQSNLISSYKRPGRDLQSFGLSKLCDADFMGYMLVQKMLQEEVESLIIDATEQSIERPNRQKPYYFRQEIASYIKN